MRRIPLETTDVELFDTDILPTSADFFHRHKDAFRQMKIDQGKEFWTRFVISFRAFSTNHGTIRDAPLPSDKMDGLYDEVFILIHEEFVEGKPNTARSFIYDIVLMAKNQPNFPSLDGKLPKSRDLFYIKESREVFRRFFGPPSSKVSYIKVYVLSPILIKFGGAACECLKRWLTADEMDPSDTSYWRPPSAAPGTRRPFKPINKMCAHCFEQVVGACFKERVNGDPKGPKWLVEWKYGDPRLNDPMNPLFDPTADKKSDWRDNLNFTKFSEFLQYVQMTYTHLVMKAYGLVIDCDCTAHIAVHGQDFSSIFIIEATEKKPSSRKAFADDFNNKTKKKKSRSKKTGQPVNEAGAGADSDADLDTDSEEEVSFQHLPSGCRDETSGLCKVMTIVDSKTGGSEIIITTSPQNPDSVDPNDVYGQFRFSQWELNEAFLRSKYDGLLPQRFRYTEVGGAVKAVFDYSVEEGEQTDKPTNFCLWMICCEEMRLKWLMTHMIGYVIKRKKRHSPGWTMGCDDIVVNMLPHLRAALWEGLCIRIQNGVDTRDPLPDETGHRPYIRTKREGTRIFGVNPVEANTWSKSPDGSLRLVESSKSPMELSRLQFLVTNMQKELRASYGRRKTLVCKNFYQHTAHCLPKCVDSVTLPIVVQRETLEEYAERVSLTISRITIALLENPAKELSKLCHDLSLQVNQQIEKSVAQKRKSLKPTRENSGPSLRDALHDYCKGMVTRLQYTEDLDSDEESAATEAVIDTIFKNVAKSARPNTTNDTPVCPLHSRCQHISQCSKCHKVTMPRSPSKVANQANSSIHKAKVSSSSSHCSQTTEKPSKACQTSVSMTEQGIEALSSLTIGQTKSQRKSPANGKEKSADNLPIDTKKTTESGTTNQVESEKAKPKTSGTASWHDNVKSVTESEHIKSIISKATKAGGVMGPRELDRCIDSVMKSVAWNPGDQKGVQQNGLISPSPQMAGERSSTVGEGSSPGGAGNGRKKNKQKRSKKSKNSSPEDRQYEAPEETKVIGGSEAQTVRTDSSNVNEKTEPELSAVKADNSGASKSTNSNSRESETSKGDNQGEGDEVKEDTSKKLRSCANCGEEEPKPKTYKKCQKCRTQEVTNPRYYCGRDCQVSDWGKRHREEHRTNTFA